MDDFVVVAMLFGANGLVKSLCMYCDGKGTVECECTVDPHEPHPCDMCDGRSKYRVCKSLEASDGVARLIELEPGDKVVFAVTYLQSTQCVIAFDSAIDAFIARDALAEIPNAPWLFVPRRAA